MAALTFDTLAFTKRLRGQFTAEQAETLAEAFATGVDEQLMTKSDLVEFERRIDAKFAMIDVRFAQVEGRFEHVDSRFAHTETRFAQLETKIAESANRMIVWTAGAVFSSSALVVALLKLMP